MGLRKPGEFHDRDVRRYGTNKAQQAMDGLLYSWAERTWGMETQLGKDFRMRVAANLATWQEQDPQADWKRTANGKEGKNALPREDDWILDQVDKLAVTLLGLDVNQYVVLCLNYGAYTYCDKISLPLHAKAAILGYTEGAYRKRLSRIRAYFVDHWPQEKELPPVREIDSPVT